MTQKRERQRESKNENLELKSNGYIEIKGRPKVDNKNRAKGH